MKQISIQIEDDQVPFVIDLLEKFDFVKIEKSMNNNYSLSKRQTELIEIERTKAKENPESLLNWDDVKDSIFAE